MKTVLVLLSSATGWIGYQIGGLVKRKHQTKFHQAPTVKAKF